MCVFTGHLVHFFFHILFVRGRFSYADRKNTCTINNIYLRGCVVHVHVFSLLSFNVMQIADLTCLVLLGFLRIVIDTNGILIERDFGTFISVR